MIANLLKAGCILLTLGFIFSCQKNENENEKHLFFLHNRFLEEHKLDELHPEYGRTEYVEILEQFRKAGFKVISEQRKGNVNAREYASKIVAQIDSLIAKGVSPQFITVVGTSKGGYIAQYVSTLANNPDLNFVFIASFTDDDIENLPGINYCGNILTIYEKSDSYGVSAIERFKASNCKNRQFKEVELNTGLQHGFLFKPLDDWINPSVQWANRNYDSIKVNDVVYHSKKLEITRLGDNVFVHKSYLKQYNNFPCNGMIYTANGEAIVFDTPTDDSISLELINWITTELECNIVAVVVNHFHIDCLGGLAEFHNMNVPSYASNLTIEIADSDKAHNNVVPKIGFKDSLKINVGNSYVENWHFGAGHSSDNIISYIKSEKTLFGGCLIKSYNANKGSLTDANVEEWSTTVQKIKKHFSDDLQFVVPGHGDPGGIELLDYTINLFEQQ